MAEILIGTSGYSFADWVGPFYPAGTPSRDFLSYYSRHFPAVEVNSTYYGIPRPRVMEQMAAKTPERYHFVVKLNQAITHQGSLDPALCRDFLAAIEPLKQAGKYDGLLAQFPWGFQRTPQNRRFLSSLRDRFPEEPLFVEFRHDSWLTPELEPSLREHRIGFCAVDEPALKSLMPPVTMVTTEDAYVRFHGRNAANWWGRGANRSASGGAPRSGSGDRYDYDYGRSELESWVKRIAELADRARRIYLFFNNCHAGQAARSAKLMQEMLRQRAFPT
jgi:uncharacterized protein YecE (DUF72 family)